MNKYIKEYLILFISLFLPIGFCSIFIVSFFSENIVSIINFTIVVDSFLSSFLLFKTETEKIKEENLKLNKRIELLNKCLEELKEIKNKNIDDKLKFCSEFISDLATINYEISAQLLIDKKRPALVEAKRIKELKN